MRPLRINDYTNLEIINKRMTDLLMKTIFPASTPRQLTTQLKNCKTIIELRRVAEHNGSMLTAFHDSVICVTCGRLGIEERSRSEAKVLFLAAAEMWLQRLEGTIGRDARSCANILHAGAKLNCDETNDVYNRILYLSTTMSHNFKAQEASNALWAAATIGCKNMSIVLPLARSAVAHIRDFTAQGACNSLWSAATLGISDLNITLPLARCCVDHMIDLTAQGASNCFWALATLGIIDESITIPIGRLCVLRSEESDLVSQNAANSFWAAATLAITDESITVPLAMSCVNRINHMSPQGLVNSLWSAATLRITNENITLPLACACVNRANELTSQGAANSFWSIATLSLTDEELVMPLIRACLKMLATFNAQNAANVLWSLATLSLVDRDFYLPVAQACTVLISDMNPQNAANSVWSAAALEITDPAITIPLASAVHERYWQLPRLDDARQCLQAHYCGVSLTPESVAHFKAILRTSPKQSSSVSLSQMGVFAALVRLGYHPKLEVPLYDGLLIIDIVIEIKDEESSTEQTKIAVEFDGPTHFLKQVRGDIGVGPVDIQTRIRNTLIRKSKEFDLLVTIPFFEWDEVQGKHDLEEIYLTQRIAH